MADRIVKCLIWDLDNTLWEGVLLEGDTVELHPQVREIIETLDDRGILQSIASRNDEEAAMRKLAEYGLEDFFLHPQINWGPKSASVAQIAERLNIATKSLAFIDDQPYEREEVAASHAEVFCIDAHELPSLLSMPAFNPRFITEDSRRRRSMYSAEIERQKVEEIMPPADFQKSLSMVFTISRPPKATFTDSKSLRFARTSSIQRATPTQWRSSMSFVVRRITCFSLPASTTPTGPTARSEWRWLNSVPTCGTSNCS